MGKPSVVTTLALALLGLVLCNKTHAQAAPNDVNVIATKSVAGFIRPAPFSKVELSPDGKYVAAIVPSPDKPQENMIAVLDAQTAKPVEVLHSGHNEMVADYFWVNNDRLIATLAIKRSGLDTPLPTGELFAINADGSQGTYLFGYRGTGDSFGDQRTVQRSRAFALPITSSPVGEDEILIQTNDFTLSRDGSLTAAARLNVRTGKSVGLGISPVPNARLIADHGGVVRVAEANNTSSAVMLWSRPSNDAPWTLLNDPAKSGVSIAPIGFNRDNTRLYVRVAHGDQPDSIDLLDMVTRQRTQLYQGKFADPGELLSTADRQDYYAVITHDGRSGLFYLDDKATESQLTKALAPNFPEQIAYFSSFTRDGKHALVRVVSDRNPGDYYLFDLDTHNARYLLSADPGIDPRQMLPMQPIALTTRDKLQLHGFLTLPSGTKPYPLIVLPHGGPHGIADQWAYDREVQLFASRGYAVLQVNYRGSGGYGMTFQDRGYRQWGLSMQDDLTDATRWAIAQGYTTPGHICIYGASYGGYAALEGVVREPDLYTCAIGYAGIYDLRVQLDDSDTQEINRGSAYLELVLGHDRADLLKRSPLGGVDNIKAHILLLHGKADPRVPFKNFQEFTAALDKAGKHYEALVESDEGHGFFVPAHQQEAYQKMLDFLDQNIGTGIKDTK